MGLVALAGFLAFVPLAVLVAMRCPFHRQPPVMPDANVESRQVLKHLTARYEDNSGKPKLLASQDALWACHSSKVKPIRTNWRGIRWNSIQTLLARRSINGSSSSIGGLQNTFTTATLVRM
ncbi:MAG: hypothetical protein ABSG11_18765 [Candidatus Korobacteraceae bacterium]